jgi:hypothetical protein
MKLEPPKPPPRRALRGYTRVNEWELVDWYTSMSIPYPHPQKKLNWFDELFMSEDQKLLEKSLMKNRMMCTEWPR